MPKLLTRIVASLLVPCLVWGDFRLRTSDFGIKSDIRIPPSKIHFTSQALAPESTLPTNTMPHPPMQLIHGAEEVIGHMSEPPALALDYRFSAVGQGSSLLESDRITLEALSPVERETLLAGMDYLSRLADQAPNSLSAANQMRLKEVIGQLRKFAAGDPHQGIGTFKAIVRSREDYLVAFARPQQIALSHELLDLLRGEPASAARILFHEGDASLLPERDKFDHQERYHTIEREIFGASDDFKNAVGLIIDVPFEPLGINNKKLEGRAIYFRDEVLTILKEEPALLPYADLMADLLSRLPPGMLKQAVHWRVLSPTLKEPISIKADLSGHLKYELRKDLDAFVERYRQNGYTPEQITVFLRRFVSFDVLSIVQQHARVPRALMLDIVREQDDFITWVYAVQTSLNKAYKQMGGIEKAWRLADPKKDLATAQRSIEQAIAKPTLQGSGSQTRKDAPAAAVSDRRSLLTIPGVTNAALSAAQAILSGYSDKNPSTYIAHLPGLPMRQLMLLEKSINTVLGHVFDSQNLASETVRADKEEDLLRAARALQSRGISGLALENPGGLLQLKVSRVSDAPQTSASEPPAPSQPTGAIVSQVTNPPPLQPPAAVRAPSLPPSAPSREQQSIPRSGITAKAALLTLPFSPFIQTWASSLGARQRLTANEEYSFFVDKKVGETAMSAPLNDLGTMLKEGETLVAYRTPPKPHASARPRPRPADTEKISPSSRFSKSGSAATSPEKSIHGAAPPLPLSRPSEIGVAPLRHLDHPNEETILSDDRVAPLEDVVASVASTLPDTQAHASSSMEAVRQRLNTFVNTSGNIEAAFARVGELSGIPPQFVEQFADEERKLTSSQLAILHSALEVLLIVPSTKPDPEEVLEAQASNDHTRLRWKDPAIGRANVIAAFRANRPDLLERYIHLDELSDLEKELLRRDIYRLGKNHAISWGLRGAFAKHLAPYFKGSTAEILMTPFPMLNLNPLGFDLDWNSPEGRRASVRYVLAREMPLLMRDYERLQHGRLDPETAEVLRRQVYGIRYKHFRAWGLQGAVDQRWSPDFDGKFSKALIESLPALELNPLGFRADYSTSARALASLRFVLVREVPSVISRYEHLDDLDDLGKEALKKDLYNIKGTTLDAWGLFGLTQPTTCPFFHGYQEAMADFFNDPRLPYDIAEATHFRAVTSKGRFSWTNGIDMAVDNVRETFDENRPDLLLAYDSLTPKTPPEELVRLQDQFYGLRRADLKNWGLLAAFMGEVAPDFEGKLYPLLNKVFPNLHLNPLGFRAIWGSPEQNRETLLYFFQKHIPTILKRYDQYDRGNEPEAELLREDIYRFTAAHFEMWDLGAVLAAKSVPQFHGSFIEALQFIFPDLELNPLGFELDWSSSERAIESMRYRLHREIPALMNEYDRLPELSDSEVDTLRERFYKFDHSHFNAWGLTNAVQKGYFSGYGEALTAVVAGLHLDPLRFRSNWSTRDKAIASLRLILERGRPDLQERYQRIELLTPLELDQLRYDIYDLRSLDLTTWGFDIAIQKRWFESDYRIALMTVFDHPQLNLQRQDFFPHYSHTRPPPRPSADTTPDQDKIENHEPTIAPETNGITISGTEVLKEIERMELYWEGLDSVFTLALTHTLRGAAGRFYADLPVFHISWNLSSSSLQPTRFLPYASWEKIFRVLWPLILGGLSADSPSLTISLEGIGKQSLVLRMRPLFLNLTIERQRYIASLLKPHQGSLIVISTEKDGDTVEIRFASAPETPPAKSAPKSKVDKPVQHTPVYRQEAPPRVLPRLRLSWNELLDKVVIAVEKLDDYRQTDRLWILGQLRAKVKMDAMAAAGIKPESGAMDRTLHALALYSVGKLQEAVRVMVETTQKFKLYETAKTVHAWLLSEAA